MAPFIPTAVAAAASSGGQAPQSQPDGATAETAEAEQQPWERVIEEPGFGAPPIRWAQGAVKAADRADLEATSAPPAQQQQQSPWAETSEGSGAAAAAPAPRYSGTAGEPLEPSDGFNWGLLDDQGGLPFAGLVVVVQVK